MLSKLPPKARLTVTFDNGRENYNHQQLTNENHNGILRRYIPKKSDLTKLPQWELDLMTEEINNKPRKCLKYQTPKGSIPARVKNSC